MKKLLYAFALTNFCIHGFTLINRVPMGGLVVISYSDPKDVHKQVNAGKAYFKAGQLNATINVNNFPKNIFEIDSKKTGQLDDRFVVISYYSQQKTEEGDLAASAKAEGVKFRWELIKGEPEFASKIHVSNFETVQKLNDPKTKVYLDLQEGKVVAGFEKDTKKLSDTEYKKKMDELYSAPQTITFPDDEMFFPKGTRARGVTKYGK